MTDPGPFEDVAVVMIAMNEEGSVRDVLRDIRRDAPGATVTIVDSSTDATPEIAAQEGAEVIRQFPPRGYGPAMVTALRAPDRPIVVTLDCDDTYPTALIPQLVEMVRGGCDVAGTTRLARPRPKAMPWPNFLANRLFNAAASVLFLRRVRDLHSGMRAYSREVVHAIPWRAEGAALPVDLLLVPMRLGLVVREIPIGYTERVGVTTLQRWQSTLWTFRRILRTRFARSSRLGPRT